MFMENSFYNIFKGALDNKSGSRPPKIELAGILLPALKGFILETDVKDYQLKMNDDLESIAKKLAWEEVTVKGYLDLETNVFEVEKINRSKTNNPPRAFSFWAGPYFEIENYKRAIQQFGKIEPALDDMVS